MKPRFILACAAGVMTLGAWWLAGPATAIDSPMRQILERQHFTEGFIHTALYPKSTKDVYAVPKRQFVHGLPRLTQPLIYEPDVYTWELAMAEHRKRMLAMAPPIQPMPGTVQPMPMDPMAVPPMYPGQVQLTPLGPDQSLLRPLPPDADLRMQRILDRAQMAGVSPDGQFQAPAIKERLINHMNSLNTPAPAPGAGISPAAPAIPLLPPTLPRGKAADSYDHQY